MTLFRNLGPFHTTAIGHGEMPLTIENNRGHDVGIETCTPRLTPAAATSTPHGPTTRRAKRNRPAKSWSAKRWTHGRGRVRKSPWPPRSVCAARGMATSRSGA